MKKKTQNLTNQNDFKRFSQTKIVLPILCIMIFSIILSANLVSASWEWDNVGSFDKKIGSYGEIEIKNALGLGETLAKYTLEDNTDVCLIDCYAEGTADFPYPTKLFSGLKYYDTRRDEKNLRDEKVLINSSQEYDWTIWETEEVCSDKYGNGTSCYKKVIGSHVEKRSREVFVEYNGELLLGKFKWIIEAKKNPEESIDWIASNLGVDLEEWAWWNTGYTYKRTIFGAGGMSESIPYPVNVSSNVTLRNGGDAFIYGIGSNNSQNYLYYNSTNVTAIANETDEFWMVSNGFSGYRNSGTKPNNLTWFLTFDETTGTNAIDYTDNVNATLTGNVVGNMSGKWGKSVQFTGTNGDYVVPSANYFPFEGKGKGTIIIFMQPAEASDVSRNAYFWGSGSNNEFFCKTDAAGDFYCWLDETNVIGTKLSDMWTPSEWIMMTFTYDVTNDVHHLYVNKTGYYTSTSAITNAPSATMFYLGAEQNTNHFKGNISHVMTFDKVLTSAEINATYDAWFSTTTMGDEAEQDFATPVSTLNSPADNAVVSDAINTFNCSGNVDAGTIHNISFYNNNTGTFVFNGSVDVSGDSTQNTSVTFNRTFNLADSVWNCLVTTNSSTTAFAPSNRTIKFASFSENSFTYNTTTYETSQETFGINITTNGTSTVTAELIYNNSLITTTTKTGTNTNPIFSRTLQINETDVNLNASIIWQINIGGTKFNATTKYQNVRPITFDLCNSTLNQFYHNITFKNETSGLENISATIDSSWQYYIGSGTINKTLSFTNTTENFNYSFCFQPANRSLNTIVNINYNNGGSQQRTYSSTLYLTNITTQTILYLLPTSVGLFSPFQTINAAGDPISLVLGTITRTISGSTITISSVYTDSSGFVTYFLNPDATYSGTFYKPGYSTTTISFVPTTDLRLVTMGGGVSVVGNGTTLPANLSYAIAPTNGSLPNNTDVLFSFNVTEGIDPVTLMSLNITNSTGDQQGFTSNSGDGYISTTLNTGNNTRLTGYFIIQTSSESISVTRVWIIGQEFTGDYSLFKQFLLFSNYQFSDFIRLMLVIATLIGVMIFMSTSELLDSSESKVAVAVLLIWAFSLVEWLNTGLVSTTTNENIRVLAQFGNQYGVAILSTCVGTFFIFRRIFIRRI